jgi:hypothetical protein
MTTKPQNMMPLTKKYNCGLSGEKRATPCLGCKDSNNCMTDAMQIKEPEVDNLEEKAVVKINAEGGVDTCAKGDVSACGYKSGAKVCGKCGAMAVEIKGGPKKINTEKPSAAQIAATVPGESSTTDADVGVGMEREMDEEAIDADQAAARISGSFDKRKARKKRMESMGMKSDDIDDDDLFVCAYSREIKSAGVAQPCSDCTGGCFTADDRPDLLTIEGIAEDSLNGKVLNSGYSSVKDVYVLRLERKDGQYVEAYITGDGEIDGWFRIPEDEALGDSDVVDVDTAMKVALGVIEGKALSTTVVTVDGMEAYAVEIDGLDGKSYDVYVTPEGEAFRYDEYVWDEDDDESVPSVKWEDIESGDGEEIASDDKEIEEKAEYTQAQRMNLAENGEAMEDGSFPITNEADLKNAIRTAGLASDKKAAKAWIIKRAKQMDLEDLLPEAWGGNVPATGKSAELMASLMEFELLSAEEEIKDLLGNE